MNRTRTKKLRRQMRVPHPGRKHGGVQITVGTSRRNTKGRENHRVREIKVIDTQAKKVELLYACGRITVDGVIIKGGEVTCPYCLAGKKAP